MKKMNNNKNITGTLIQNIREIKGISRANLSIKLELLGIYLDRNEIYRLEKNKRFLKDFELIGISKALNIDLNTLKDLFE